MVDTSLLITTPGKISNPAGPPIYVPPYPVDTQPVARYSTVYSTADVAEAVASLIDLAGGAPLAAASPKQPVVAIVDDVPVLTFDGVDDQLRAVYALDGAHALTFALAVNIIAVAANKVIVDVGGRRLFLNASNQFSLFLTGGGAGGVAGVTGWHFFAGRFSATATALFVDGNKYPGASAGTATGAGTTNLGALSSATATNMQFAELAVFESELTDADVAAVRADMRARFPFLP